MKFVVLLVGFLITQASSADTPADQTMLRKYSYEKLEQAADYLGAKVENPSEKILNCDPSPEKANAWLAGPVRELIDRSREAELRKFKQDPKSYIRKVKGCSERCTCNGYSLMLSDMSDATESAMYKDLDALLTAETKKLTPKQSLSCARKLKWFCKSPLHSYLLQQ